MNDINPAAKAAMADARRSNGEFGFQTHAGPEAQLSVDRLTVLAAGWRDVADKEAVMKDAAQYEAAHQLRLLAPYNAENIRFTIQPGDDPFERSHIKSVEFINLSGHELDADDQHEVDDMVSFLDVAWVRENADETFYDGIAFIAVGPQAEAGRLPELISELERAEPGEAYRQLLHFVTDTADYVTRGRTNQAGYAGIVAKAGEDGSPVAVGFRQSDETFVPLDEADPQHTAAAEHLRYAVQVRGWEPDQVDGQHIRRV